MGNNSNIHIRYMHEQDLPDVVQIQYRAHAKSLHESPDVFYHKQSIFNDGCFVAECDSGICGYLFSHPWITEYAVPLNSIYSLPDVCNTFYIHDCSVDPDFQKQGIGLRLFIESKKTALTLNYHSLQLTCIKGMQNYWTNLGFTIVPGVATRCYGDNACLMHSRCA
ncbi:MAG: GNAT family N-acetyltransferase [Fibrobacter sp.]|nr:GNAT family N-acetyltransferase [Fibrobacter sp.]